jgi:hypothetical protein
MSLATWIASRLVVQAKNGSWYAPGGGRGHVWKQEDGIQVTLVSRGDAFDLFIGKQTIYNVTVTPTVALAMARWLIAWWAFATLFGVKTWLWNWARGRLVPSAGQTSSGNLQ